MTELLFLGGYNSFASYVVEYTSLSPYSHVGIYLNLGEPITFNRKDEEVTIPVGEWMIHATPCINEHAIGPAKQGVIVVPVILNKIDANVCTRIRLPRHADMIAAITTLLTECYGDDYGYLNIAMNLFPVTTPYNTRAYICTSLVTRYIFQLYNYDTKYVQSPVALRNAIIMMPGVAMIGSPNLPSSINVIVGILLLLYAAYATFRY